MLCDLPKEKSRVPISCSAQSSMADLIAIDLVQASMLARVRKNVLGAIALKARFRQSSPLGQGPLRAIWA
jgi:hypothetical protein